MWPPPDSQRYALAVVYKSVKFQGELVPKLTAIKNRGEFKGEPLFPHKHKDNTYVASSSRYEIDYIPVDTEEELESLVRAGYGVRMSNPNIKQAASFIASDKISILFSAEQISPKSLLPKLSNEIDLDSDSKSKSRKEQSFLRAHLANNSLTGKCILCESQYPIEMLVAAHIKKRANCTIEEKLDFDNVAALMCKVGCDDLYEKGYVVVKDGVVVKNVKRRTTPHLDKVIDKIDGRMVSNWSGSSKYYQWHESKFNT